MRKDVHFVGWDGELPAGPGFLPIRTLTDRARHVATTTLAPLVLGAHAVGRLDADVLRKSLRNETGRCLLVPEDQPERLMEWVARGFHRLSCRDRAAERVADLIGLSFRPIVRGKTGNQLVGSILRSASSLELREDRFLEDYGRSGVPNARLPRWMMILRGHTGLWSGIEEELDGKELRKSMSKKEYASLESRVEIATKRWEDYDGVENPIVRHLEEQHKALGTGLMFAEVFLDTFWKGVTLVAGFYTGNAVSSAARAGYGSSRIVSILLGAGGGAVGGGIESVATQLALEGGVELDALKRDMVLGVAGYGVLNALDKGVKGISKLRALASRVPDSVPGARTATTSLSRASLVARERLRGLLQWIGTRDLPLRVHRTLGIRAQRAFVTATVKHPGVAESPILSLLERIPGVSALRWQQHHIFIQRRWFALGRGGAETPSLWYGASERAARLGLQRLGNAGWNLVPIPGRLNAWLFRTPGATEAFALLAAGSVPASGIGGYWLGEQAAEQVLGVGDGE